MTSYLATIRFEASSRRDARMAASHLPNALGRSRKAELVDVSEDGDRDSEPPRYVTEAIEAAKVEIRQEIAKEVRDTARAVICGYIPQQLTEWLDEPSDVLVERVAKRLAARRLMRS